MDRDSVVPKVRRIPGPHAKRWVEFHMKYASKSTYEPEFVWDRTAEAIGPFCTDVDDNIIMDFVSHVGAAPLGYNNPQIVELMHRIKLQDPDRYAGTDFIAGYGKSPSKSNIPTPAHLHHKVREITKHLGFDTAFFSNSGTEAVENAIKVCYDYRKNNGYGINFDGAFHGRTLGALSLNRSKKVHRSWFPTIPKIHTLPFISENQACSCGNIISKQGKLTHIEDLLDKKVGIIKPEEVAYIIMEPIQGEGGYNFPDPEFIKNIYEVASKNDIPVISDEVQSGMGRTGKWWAVEHYKVKPDVISSAKALRVGATIGKKKIFPKESGRISSTWGEGNAIASAVAYETIEIMQKKKLLDNATRVGKYFLNRLQELVDRYSFVTHAMGLGLMLKIDIDTHERRNKIKEACLKKGLLIAGAGFNTIRFLPPLDVTKREVDICCDILDEVCRGI